MTESLEYIGMRWLQLEKNCPIILRERCPRYHCGVPDILGITSARYLIEIEVKRSKSDFAADSQKPHRINWELNIEMVPKFMFYLVPNSMVKKVEHLTPNFAGLIVPELSGRHWVKVVKEAPQNTRSRRLTVKECCKIPRLLTNFCLSTQDALERHLNSWRHGHAPWPEPDYEI